MGQAATSPYPDVPRSHWASGYVEAAVTRGLISGFSDGTFRPNQEIKLAEAVSMVLALLGYGPEDFSGAFPTGQLAMYHSLKLDRGVTALQASSPLTRQDGVYLFYNLLSAKTKEGAPYIQQLGHSLDPSGKPDVVALINGQMEGPVVVQGYGWQSSLGFTPGKVYRNGSAATLSNIQDYDVVYWNAAMNTPGISPSDFSLQKSERLFVISTSLEILANQSSFQERPFLQILKNRFFSCIVRHSGIVRSGRNCSRSFTLKSISFPYVI